MSEINKYNEGDGRFNETIDVDIGDDIQALAYKPGCGDEEESAEMSIAEAEEMWLSHGMDPKYKCGFTEEELRDSLL